MITSLQIGSINITGDPYSLESFNGLASPTVENVSYSRPDIRGVEFLKSRLRQRILDFSGYIHGATPSSYAQNRMNLISALDPSYGTFQVKFSTVHGLHLQCDAILRSPIDSQLLAGEEDLAVYRVELEVPKGEFEGQTEKSVTVALNSSNTAVNLGNLGAFPRLRVYGPGDAIKIRNWALASGEMQLNGVALASGEYVDIDVRARTVLRNNLQNELGTFSGDWWLLDKGSNLINFLVASGSSAASEVDVFWRDTYLGV